VFGSIQDREEEGIEIVIPSPGLLKLPCKDVPRSPRVGALLKQLDDLDGGLVSLLPALLHLAGALSQRRAECVNLGVGAGANQPGYLGDEPEHGTKMKDNGQEDGCQLFCLAEGLPREAELSRKRCSMSLEVQILLLKYLVAELVEDQRSPQPGP
jgi:hypothetical protein